MNKKQFLFSNKDPIKKSGFFKKFHRNFYKISAILPLVPILFCILFPRPSFSNNLCSDFFPRTAVPPDSKIFKDLLVRELTTVLKKEQTHELPARLKDCGPGCLELESNSSSLVFPSSSSPSVFRIELGLKFTEPRIVFSRQTGIKTLKVPRSFFSSSSSENLLRQWLIGHELHPYSSLSSGRPLVKPVQTEAFRAYDEAVKEGYRSFLHIAPTAFGKGLVLSRALIRRIKNMEPGKKIIFVAVDRIHLVNQISSAIKTLTQSKNLPPVRLINWNNKKENSDNSARLFLEEVREAVNRKTETPTVFFITSQSLKLRLDDLREMDSDLHRDLVSSLESLFLDEVHHYGASQTGRFLENLVEESGAFLFGSTATPIHPEVKLTDLFEVSHFSYLREGNDLFGSVSKKTLLQLSRAIERGDITGFDDIYILGETLFKRPDASESLFVRESESGYQVINPHYYNRLVELLSPILLSNRRGFIVAASIREAERLSEHLNGVFGESLTFFPFHSGMSRKERQEVLERSREGTDKSHFIVSVRALDERINLPGVSAYIDLNSNVSVKQMLHIVGRVLKLSPGKLESDVVLLSDYKNQSLSKDLLELLDAMKVVPGFGRNEDWRSGALNVGVLGRVITREELSTSRELFEEVVRSYWSRNGKVDYEIFVSRVQEALEKGELDPNSMVKTYLQWQKNHPDMPSNPVLYYKGQFPGWTKLLGREKVDYEIFVSRVQEALEKGELDPLRIKETYRQWQKNHPDMPSNPVLYYKGQFPGWKKLIEESIAKKREKEYEIFKRKIFEALERGELDPKRMYETYLQWQKNHPDMPLNPYSYYNRGRFPWRTLEEYRAKKREKEYGIFVSRVQEALEKGELNPDNILKTYSQWRKNHPGMPSDPRLYYRGQFPGWNKLVEEYRAKKREKEYGIFVSRVQEALEKGELNPDNILKTYRHWRKNHPDMPSSPRLYYRGQFPGWTQFLGREVVNFVDYEIFVSRVQEAVKKGELHPNNIAKIYSQWQKSHPDIPSDPRSHYRGQFPGWKKFLGKEKVDYGIFVSRVLEALEKGELDPNNMVKTYFQWQKNHLDMPPEPRYTYGDQFPGWTKILGREKVDYGIFVSRVLEALEKGELYPNSMEKTYHRWRKNYPDMPSSPLLYYGGQFPGWTKLLGREKVEYWNYR